MDKDMIQTEKRCKRCGRTLPVEAFYWNRVRKNKMGRPCWCRECTREYMRGRYKRGGVPVGTVIEMKGHEFVKVSTTRFRMVWTRLMINTLRQRREEGWSWKGIGEALAVSPTACRVKWLEMEGKWE